MQNSYMHTYDCHQNELNLRSQKITKKHVHRNCESGLAIIHKHVAHRLVQHKLQVVEITWTDDSTLAIFFYMRYR